MRIVLAFAALLALPAMAHAAQPAPEKCCCEKMKGDKGCCDKDKRKGHDEHSGHEGHSGHQMEKPAS